tara:strand:+ start:180 stop:335 length:156 start_codon:yes stop_codon:yes gene_type:complete
MSLKKYRMARYFKEESGEQVDKKTFDEIQKKINSALKSSMQKLPKKVAPMK